MIKSRQLFVTICLLLLTLASVGSAAPGGHKGPDKRMFLDEHRGRKALAVTDEILLKFKPGVSSETKSRIIKQIMQTQHHSVMKENRWFTRMRLPKGTTLEEAIKSLGEIQELETVEPDYVVQILGAPVNDVLFPDQWSLGIMRVPDAWSLTQGLSDTLVAVIDTGVELTHEDIRGSCTGGYNFIADNDDAPVHLIQILRVGDGNVKIL